MICCPERFLQAELGHGESMKLFTSDNKPAIAGIVDDTHLRFRAGNALTVDMDVSLSLIIPIYTPTRQRLLHFLRNSSNL
jgi:hypothetical protein